MYRDFFNGAGGSTAKADAAFDLDSGKGGIPHLTTIYNALAAGKSEREIEKEHKINLDDIAKAKRLLIQNHPDLYAQVAGKAGSPYSFLLDENIFFDDRRNRNRHIVSLWRDFGRVTHTNHENLRTHGDKDILNWARSNHVNAIITQDINMGHKHEDLSLIALYRAYNRVQLSLDERGFYDARYTRHLPVVVQLTPRTTSSKMTMAMLHHHRGGILEFMKNPESIILRLSPDGAAPILSYKEMAASRWSDVRRQAVKITDDYSQKLKMYNI